MLCNWTVRDLFIIRPFSLTPFLSSNLFSVKGMGAQSDVLKQQLSNMTAAKEVDDEQILSLQSLVKQANDEIERLKGFLADMTAAKNASDARISTLEGQSRDDADKMASLRKQVSELEDVLHRTREEMAIMTTKYADMTTSSAAANEEAVDLKSQLSAHQISSSLSLVDLQAQLKSARDELTALADKHTELSVMNAQANKQVEAMIAQGKDDTNEIANQIKRIAQLEVKVTESTQAIANSDKQLEATKHELIDLQASSSTIIADWEMECKRHVAELAAMTTAHTDATAASAAAMAVAERTIAEWETMCKKKDIEIASFTDQQTNLRASSAAAKNVGDKVIETLKNQLSALQTSSSQSVSDLQARLKTMNDEASALIQKYDVLSTAKRVTDQQVELLTVQGQKDADDIVALKALIKAQSDDMATLTTQFNEVTAAKAESDTQMSSLMVRGQKDADEILALTMRASELETQVKRYAFR